MTDTMRHRFALSALVAFTLSVGALMAGASAHAAITMDGNVWYAVVNVNSGKALELYNWLPGDGAEFRQWHRLDGTNQQFQLVSSGNGYYRLKNRHSGKVVDVWNFSKADGAAVNQYTDGDGVNQQWRLVGSDNNAVRFINRNSGKALEVANASTADGGDITQYTDYGGRNQTWALVPIGSVSPPPTGGTGNVKLPSSFHWSSSAALLVAKPAARFPEVAIKDPTVVYHNGLWHVFSTQAKGNGWGLEYRSFADWSNAGTATPYFLDATAIGAGYRAAPFVFFHAPSRLWYLVFQNGNAAYSTNPDISNPGGWSQLRTFYRSVPAIVQQNISSKGGHWLDFAVACDSVNCHLFSAGDNGQIYRSQTTLGNFPNGFGDTVIALEDANRNNLFEAPQVYKVRETGQYLLIVEAMGSSGRYFRSWTASSLSGTWTPLAATESNPFAGNANVSFPTGKWSQGISHGEILRTGYDQNVEISVCNMRFLYQGLTPGAKDSYDSLPYRLGILTQTNSPC